MNRGMVPTWREIPGKEPPYHDLNKYITNLGYRHAETGTQSWIKVHSHLQSGCQECVSRSSGV